MTALIETFHPALLFTLPDTRKRMDAVREMLGRQDYELPANSANGGAAQARAADGAIGSEEKSSEQDQAGLQAQRRLSNDADFYTRRGMIYADRGDGPHALADFNKALELDPDCASALDKRSILYLSAGEREKALADLNAALALEPNHAEYYEHRGMLYHMHQDIVHAMAD